MTPAPRRPTAWPRAFTHPLFWAALSLLLLNDHVFKHSGQLSAALTGKLSDVMGMLVAPPLVALALGAQRVRARVIAAAWIGACFALIKLAPEATLAFERSLLLIGIRARIWHDPSDLWALLALPIGYALCRPRTELAIGPALDWTRRAGIALSAIACIATSSTSSKGKSGTRGDAPAIKNATSSTLTLVVTSTDGAGGCVIYRDDRISALTADAFTTPREVTLEAGAQAPLPMDTATTPCGAASIGLPNGEDSLLFWRGLDEIASFVPANDARRLARLAVLSGKPGHFKIDLGDDLRAFELGGQPPDATCKQTEATHSLEATALATPQGFLELAEVRTGQDGCLEVDWLMAEGDTAVDTQRLCVPDWAFPFTQGQRLSVTQTLSSLGERVLRITRFAGSSIDTQLVIWNDATNLHDSHIKSLTPANCVGSLTSCGAYVRPIEASVSGKSSVLVSGAEVDIKGNAPKQVRVLLGPARDVAWTNATCQGTEARLGPSANLLELRSY